MLHIHTHKYAQKAAIVVGVATTMIVALIALVAGDRSWVSHAIVHGIDIHSAAIARTKKHGNDASGSETLHVAQDIFGAVILVMPIRIVHGVEVLVAHR